MTTHQPHRDGEANATEGPWAYSESDPYKVGTYSEETTAVFLPRWMAAPNTPVGRHAWLDGWRNAKARPETLRVATAMTATGFSHKTGHQTRPKAMSVIAQDAGCSTSSVKRFLSKARNHGWLTPTGQHVTLVAGLRSTPLYSLTLPADPTAPFAAFIPEALRVEMEALILLEQWMATQCQTRPPWSHDTGCPPTWAVQPQLAAA